MRTFHTCNLSTLWLYVSLCLVALGTPVFAQDQEEVLEADTVKPEAPVKIKDRRPRNAAIMSALLPGLGQAYNKKYWKIPIVYGLGYCIFLGLKYNNGYYNAFRNAYRDTTTSAASPSSSGNHSIYNTSYKDVRNFAQYSPDQLKLFRDSYRRDRDLCIILALGLYVLNIVDATVDAHLKTFNVSDNLTLHWEPRFNLAPNNTPIPGISMNLTFKQAPSKFKGNN